MAVSRCMCTGVTFADVKRCAEEVGGDYEETISRTRCGEGCGLCLPYIKLVLLTGMIDFPVLTPELYRKLIAQYTPAPVVQMPPPQGDGACPHQPNPSPPSTSPPERASNPG